jgi:hypothetical protein
MEVLILGGIIFFSFFPVHFRVQQLGPAISPHEHGLIYIYFELFA